MTAEKQPWFAEAAAAKQAKLTHERLCEVLAYDPITGNFTRLQCPLRPYLVGKVAGSRRASGIHIAIDQLGFSAHRLAWFYMTKTWPTGEIDHMDGNPHNNSWLNLRDGDRFQNQQNLRRAKSTNKSGLLGAMTTGGLHCSKISVRGKSIFLGYFDTAEAAHQAYVAAKRNLHTGCTL